MVKAEFWSPGGALSARCPPICSPHVRFLPVTCGREQYRPSAPPPSITRPEQSRHLSPNGVLIAPPPPARQRLKRAPARGGDGPIEVTQKDRPRCWAGSVTHARMTVCRAESAPLSSRGGRESWPSGGRHLTSRLRLPSWERSRAPEGA